jgi:hypothetical protein
MALKGNLRDFTITQLLNLVNIAKKNGTLVIEGSNGTAKTTFSGGKLANAEISGEESHLGIILHKSKIISNAQLTTINNRAAAMTDKELGLLLINSGYVTQKDIIISLQSHFIKIIQRLYSWVEGSFYFDQNTNIPKGNIPIKLDLENIIIEGSRQIREQELLSDELPNLDLALKFTDRPGIDLKKINLNVSEWKVISNIKSDHSIKIIGNEIGMGELEIRKIVYSLLQAGLVELIRPQNEPKRLPGLEKVFSGKSKDEQKKLVNRLITRIRSL